MPITSDGSITQTRTPARFHNYLPRCRIPGCCNVIANNSALCETCNESLPTSLQRECKRPWKKSGAPEFIRHDRAIADAITLLNLDSQDERADFIKQQCGIHHGWACEVMNETRHAEYLKMNRAGK